MIEFPLSRFDPSDKPSIEEVSEALKRRAAETEKYAMRAHEADPVPGYSLLVRLYRGDDGEGVVVGLPGENINVPQRAAWGFNGKPVRATAHTMLTWAFSEKFAKLNAWKFSQNFLRGIPFSGRCVWRSDIVKWRRHGPVSTIILGLILAYFALQIIIPVLGQIWPNSFAIWLGLFMCLMAAAAIFRFSPEFLPDILRNFTPSFLHRFLPLSIRTSFAEHVIRSLHAKQYPLSTITDIMIIMSDCTEVAYSYGKRRNYRCLIDGIPTYDSLASTPIWQEDRPLVSLRYALEIIADNRWGGK